MDFILKLLQTLVLINAPASLSEYHFRSIIFGLLQLVEYVLIAYDATLLSVREYSLLTGFQVTYGIISLLGKVIKSCVQIINLKIVSITEQLTSCAAVNSYSFTSWGSDL